MHIRIRVGTNLVPFLFLDQICPKKVFLVKNRKVSITIELWIFKLVQVPSFSSNLLFWFFGPNLPKNNAFGQKWKKWIFYCIFRLALVPNFYSNWELWFFEPNLHQKGYFCSKTEKTSRLNSVWSNWSGNQISA